MMGFSSVIVGFCCQFWRLERPEVDSFSIYVNLRSPSFSLFNPNYAFVPTSVIRLLLTVAGILILIADSQIIFAIVESMVVPVVYLNLFRRVLHGSVHKNLRFVFSSGRIKHFHALCPLCVPVPLTEPIVIIGVNDSGLALRKRDKAVGLVDRLDDFVSYYTRFSHVSSSIGDVLSSRTLTWSCV